MRRHFGSLSAALCGLALALAMNGADGKDPLGLGIRYPSQADSAWRSKLMSYPGKPGPDDFHDSGEDFFTWEYGKPCVFTEDWISGHGFHAGGNYAVKDGALVFKTGKWGFSFGFGPAAGVSDKPRPRFGANWPDCEKDVFRLKMAVSQDVPETKWRFQVIEPNKYSLPKEFTVKGDGEQLFMTDLGLVRELKDGTDGVGGVRFTCLTPGAKVEIKSLEIAPYSADVYFRREFELPWKPVMAHATFDAPEDYDVFVNGQKVAEGNRIYFPGTVRSVDLTQFLRKGGNVIAIRKNFFSWLRKAPVVMFEGFAAGRDGEIFRILGGDGWRCALSAPAGWEKPGFDDSTWKKAKPLSSGIEFITQNISFTGKEVFTGVNPRHMGVLDAVPLGHKYPVFEADDKEIGYALRLPAGLRGVQTPSLKVLDADSGKLVEEVTGTIEQENADLTSYKFIIKTRGAGAYSLLWRLSDAAGKVSEERKDEMIVAGPIRQDEYALKDFEEELSRRLKPELRIDCATEPESDTAFIDHAGMYRAVAANKGRVVERRGMKYRETGRDQWDYFAYRLPPLEFGAPYMVEVVVPDDEPRNVQSGVVEYFPIRFRNNSKGRGAWSATGSCFTGGRYLLSGKTRALRYLYWPASETAAVYVINGYQNHPAAVCAINVYRVEGGLPALKIPATGRMFGSFNERISVMSATTGMVENAMFDVMLRRNGNNRGWYCWYKAIERKIQWLRFQGRNMTSEGVYMYGNGDYPSLKHNSDISNQELDPVLLAVKMYGQNKINCMLGVEYSNSPALYSSPGNRTSDRKVQAGEDTLYLVDKNGKQMDQRESRGVNFLHPKAAAAFYDTIAEIYDFYKNAGPIAGLCLNTGKYHQPSFMPSCRNAGEDLGLLDIGYGDYTVGLFEQETGTALGVAPKDPGRFAKRYELLTGKHRHLWLSWRATKIKASLDRIAGIITAGENKWRLYVIPYLMLDKDNPFIDDSGTPERRAKFVEDSLFSAGYQLPKYAGNSDITLVTRMLRRYRLFPEMNSDYIEGWNSRSRKIIGASGAVFFYDRGLPMFFDEIDCPAGGAKNWFCDSTTRGVFVSQGMEDNAMEPFVNAVADPIPKVVLYSLLDCNMDTGHGAAIRRFCASFYATPELTFTALPEKKAKGVFAQRADTDGKTYLRLINNSPWPSTGWFRADAGKVRDNVYGGELSSAFLSGGKYDVRMKPYDIRVFELDEADGEISCEFALPTDVADKVVAAAESLLKNKRYLSGIPGDAVSGMFFAAQAGDAFTLFNLMDDFEVKNSIRKTDKAREALDNQRKLLDDLSRGRARINCACEVEFIAPDGSRWLPDQKHSGVEAYGNEGASFVDRGKMQIADTELDRVYQTEAYGERIAYAIPVPDGSYNLYLHFAETYTGNQHPGCRQITVSVNGVRHPEIIDPFVNAGGWAKPYVLKLKNVPVHAGKLELKLSGGAGINGFEIEKAE